MLGYNVDDAFAFYDCPSLNCYFYYRDMKRNWRPVLSTLVRVTRLDKHVVIKLIGIGAKTLPKVLGKDLFPVDLYSRPPKIDPRLSRTVSAEMLERWDILVREFLVKQWFVQE